MDKNENIKTGIPINYTDDPKGYGRLYYIANKEKSQAWGKLYRKENKDVIKEYQSHIR